MRSAATATRGLLVVLLLAILVMPAAAPASPRVDRTEAAILREMNKIRKRHHLPRLRSNPALLRAADAHSAHMLRSKKLSHGAFERRLRRYVHSRQIGETLAWMTRCNATQVVRMWMRSRDHRRIMLSHRYRRVGVGRRAASRSCMVTADFASRR